MAAPYAALPQELIDLVFVKLLEYYSPKDMGEMYGPLFSSSDCEALSAFSTISLMVARRTRTHRFECIVILCHQQATKFYQLLASFLELSVSSRHMGRLHPISTITTHVKVLTPYYDGENILHDRRMLSFLLRLRKEFSLKQLSWRFHPRSELSVQFHERFAGLLLSPGMETMAMCNFTSSPSRLQGANGRDFYRVIRFGEEEDESNLPHAHPFYIKLDLRGPATSALPLPFSIALPNGTVYRPFSRVQTFLASDGLPHSITEAVLRNNDGTLEVLHLAEALDFHGGAITFGPKSKPTSPIPFSCLPKLREVKLDFYPRRAISIDSFQQIRPAILESLLALFNITIPSRQNNTTPVETLDLGRIYLPILAHSLPTDEHPSIQDSQSNAIASALDMQDPWEDLDQVLCSPSFNKLKLLKVDYFLVKFFSPSSRPQRPQGNPNGGPQVGSAQSLYDWLSITSKIFPRVVAQDSIRLEGRVIQLRVVALPRKIMNCVSVAFTSQYP